jgi:hypothetical protein
MPSPAAGGIASARAALVASDFLLRFFMVVRPFRVAGPGNIAVAA